MLYKNLVVGISFFSRIIVEVKNLENSIVKKALFANEDLLILGIGLSILGFYVIAEWEIIAGLSVVLIGYSTIIATTEIAKQTFHIVLLKLNSLNITEKFLRIYLSIKTFCVG